MCLLLALLYAKFNDVVRDRYGLNYILLAKCPNILATSWMAAFCMTASWMTAC